MNLLRIATTPTTPAMYFFPRHKHYDVQQNKSGPTKALQITH
jgi:hypothetical protein